MSYTEVHPIFGTENGVVKVFSKVGRYNFMCSPKRCLVRWLGEDMMI